jgi:MIP family channel proteins
VVELSAAHFGLWALFHNPATTMNSTAKAGLAEAIGTFTLTLIGAGSGAATAAAAGATGAGATGLVIAALAHGVALMIIIYTWGTISGAHVNPAVTLGALVGGKIDLGKSIVYWIAQFVGAAAAAYLLLYLVGDVGLKEGLTVGRFTESDSAKVIVIEAVLTFFLVSAVYSAGLYNRFGNAVGLAIGFVLTADILFGGPYTGASMNPARSFGPFLALGNMKYFWLYVVGPAIGGVLAGIVQAYVIGGDQDKK